MHVDSSDFLSITVASKIGIFGLIHAVEEGREHILTRNNKPVTVIVGI